MLQKAFVDPGVLTLWLRDGRPSRMVWGGRRWRVTDTPTLLFARDMYYLGLLTHLPEHALGWRFQAHPEDGGPSCVFDVVGREDHWTLAHVASDG